MLAFQSGGKSYDPEFIGRDDTFDQTLEEKEQTDRIVKAVLDAILEDRKLINTKLTTETNDVAAAFKNLDIYNREIGNQLHTWVNYGNPNKLPATIRTHLEQTLGSNVNPGQWSASARILVPNMIDSIIATPFALTHEHIDTLQKNMKAKNS